MGTIHVATIQVAVNAGSHAEATDAISECLGWLQDKGTEIFDWQYLKIGCQYLYPQDTGVPYVLEEYIEGAAFGEGIQSGPREDRR
jgi:hypothetical protein